MAKRPIQQKRADKLRRTMMKDPPVASIDLIKYLKDRGYAKTSGEARELLELGNVMADSHPLGQRELMTNPHARPMAPAGLRDRIRVTPLPS